MNSFVFTTFEKMIKKGTILLAISLPIQIVFIKWLSHKPILIEQYYSNGIYPILSKAFRYTLGWIPFSFGDIFYTILGVFIIKWLYHNFKFIWKKPLYFFTNVIAFLASIYFIFHFLWGLNYYRNPLHKTLDLNATYTTEQLINVTERLAKISNKIHLKITKNDTVKVVVPYNRDLIFQKSSSGYNNLKREFPALDYTPKSIKKSLYSIPLTYMGFSGYFNPFTGEGQVNGKIPLYRFPFVTCHEEAHQLGFSAENETNFIGILATIKNPNIYFQYSGYTAALRYCLNELYVRDKSTFERIMRTVSVGIQKNFLETNTFWNTHENPLEPVFKKSFDTFLKANNQSKGIKSYSYVVALLVNYNEKSSF